MLSLIASAAQKKLGIQDPRSTRGILSRGANVYNSGSLAATKGPLTQTGKSGQKYYVDSSGKRIVTSPAPQPNLKPILQPGEFQGWPGESHTPPATSTTPTGEVIPPNNLETFPTFSPNPTTPGSTGQLYDAIYAATQRRLAEQEAGISSNIDFQNQRLNEDTSLQQSQYGKQLTKSLEQLQARMADQGLTYSGINVGQQGQLGTAYQDSLDTLFRNRARSMEDITRQATTQREQIRTAKEQAEFDRAQRIQDIELQRARDQANTQSQQDFFQQLTQQLQDNLKPEQTGQYPISTGPDYNAQYRQAIAQVNQMKAAGASKTALLEKEKQAQAIKAAAQRKVGV